MCICVYLRTRESERERVCVCVCVGERESVCVRAQGGRLPWCSLSPEQQLRTALIADLQVSVEREREGDAERESRGR